MLTIKSALSSIALLAGTLCALSAALAAPYQAQLGRTIDQYLQQKQSPIAGNGQVFFDQGLRWDVDPRLVVAIAGQEQDFGKAVSSCNSVYNAWSWFYNGLRCPDASFASWAEGINTVTKYLRVSYFDRSHLYTILAIKTMYCKEKCGNWVANVEHFYESDLGGDPSDLTFPPAPPPTPALSVIYSFGAKPNDGDFPYGGLVQNSDGNFYGTTLGGGAINYGTLFKVATSGAETVLYSFGSGADGKSPNGVIQGTDGNFYGTARFGGLYGAGVVFKITASGAETILHSFTGSGDGNYPNWDLVEGSDGNYYGTTSYGGAAPCSYGTVFRITPAGQLSVLHSFSCVNDGNNPWGPLVQGGDGNFYGVTAGGGQYDAGTVFKMTPAGAETVLYSFDYATDGGYPLAPLVRGVDGMFYGVTDGLNITGAVCGAVYKITTSGVKTTLYRFACGNDGRDPESHLLLASDGNIYGTTIRGGQNGGGTIFVITPSGQEKVLYPFPSHINSVGPGSLIQGRDGNLYGTTGGGGTFDMGTIFELGIGAP